MGAADRLLPKLAGRRVGEALARGTTFDKKVDWDWNRDKLGRTTFWLGRINEFASLRQQS